MIAAGWRQGVILEPGSLEEAGIAVQADAVGFLVLTQTCDCVNPDFSKEPYLELLPLVPRNTKKGNPDPDFENGKNPREIHFWITLKDQRVCVVSRIKEIQLIDRERIEALRFSKEVVLSREVMDDIIEWRASRYSRTAFPEAFEAAFRPITASFGEIISRHEPEIDSLLISITPFDEIEVGDAYEIELHLMVMPSMMGQPETIESLKKSAQEIEALLKQCDAFGSVECRVTSLDGMTLWEARKLMDFSRYDYLSFGKEEASPEP